MRLAVFSPLPPVRSGIADYTVELLGALGARHTVEAFVASADEVREWHGRAAGFHVRDAHDFVWAAARAPYDAIVYQMGNAWCHDYTWPYLFAYPGLVVLHDGHLHHARAWSLMRRGRQDDYRAELAFNHPDLPPEAAEIALSGFAGPIYYHWPMLRTVVESARLVLVHNRGLADELERMYPAAHLEHVSMGVAEPEAEADAVAAVRARCGCEPESVLVAAFGAITPEKRLEPLLRALALARRHVPRVRLLLVGQSMPHLDAVQLARELGVADMLVMPGYVPDAALPAFLHASDVVMSLRWPSGGETSASWLRALAAGRATVVTELAQQAALPTLDPRTWTVAHADPTLGRPAPIAVGIDVLDELHSLTLALKRLLGDAPLRQQLGASARAWWAEHHTVPQMAAGYERALARAAGLPAGATPLPGHLRPDPAAFARRLGGRFPGVPILPSAMPVPPVRSVG